MSDEAEDQAVPVTTQELAEVFECTPQQVRMIAALRHWEPVRRGRQGRGKGNLYDCRDAIAEASSRLERAEAQARAERQRIERLKAIVEDRKAREGMP